MRARIVRACIVLLGLGFAPLASAQPKDTLTIDLPGQPASLDPHVQWDTDSYKVYRNIFDNLISRDVTGKIVPQVATAWNYRSNTEIDFTIRTDIRFHDGTPLTAEDVVYSVRRIIDPNFKSPQLSQFNSIVKAEAVAANVVRITTQTPYPALLAQLVKLSIVPKAYVEKAGNDQFNMEPIGSGPYKMANWQRGVRVTLAANDNYWGGKPPFRTVQFNAVPDEATRIANLQAGRSDLIRQVSPDQASALKSDARIKILAVATERIGYLFINPSAGPTKDLRVRQAIAYAIDRKSIIDALLMGFGAPVNVLVTPANFGYIPDIAGYPFDLPKAKALVKEAKAEGAEISFLTSPAYDQRIVQAIQQMLQEAGLKVNIAFSDHPTFLKRRQGTPEEAGALSLGRWSCSCQDADGVIHPLFRTGGIWSKYSNAEYDKAVDAARATLDEKERLAHYRRAFEILRDELPGIGIYQDNAIYAARRELQWQPTPNEAMFVMEMAWR
jgi:peptide/nickel transport system substrate-binding protein